LIPSWEYFSWEESKDKEEGGVREKKTFPEVSEEELRKKLTKAFGNVNIIMELPLG